MQTDLRHEISMIWLYTRVPAEDRLGFKSLQCSHDLAPPLPHLKRVHEEQFEGYPDLVLEAVTPFVLTFGEKFPVFPKRL